MSNLFERLGPGSQSVPLDTLDFNQRVDDFVSPKLLALGNLALRTVGVPAFALEAVARGVGREIERLADKDNFLSSYLWEIGEREPTDETVAAAGDLMLRYASWYLVFVLAEVSRDVKALPADLPQLVPQTAWADEQTVEAMFDRLNRDVKQEVEKASAPYLEKAGLSELMRGVAQDRIHAKLAARLKKSIVWQAVNSQVPYTEETYQLRYGIMVIFLLHFLESTAQAVLQEATLPPAFPPDFFEALHVERMVAHFSADRKDPAAVAAIFTGKASAPALN